MEPLAAPSRLPPSPPVPPAPPTTADGPGGAQPEPRPARPGLWQFLLDCWQQLRRVEWPRGTALDNAVVVLTATLVLIVVVGVVSWASAALTSALLGR